MPRSNYMELSSSARIEFPLAWKLHCEPVPDIFRRGGERSRKAHYLIPIKAGLEP